jgi:hypothetical protein
VAHLGPMASSAEEASEKPHAVAEGVQEASSEKPHAPAEGEHGARPEEPRALAKGEQAHSEALQALAQKDGDRFRKDAVRAGRGWVAKAVSGTRREGWLPRHRGCPHTDCVPMA